MASSTGASLCARLAAALLLAEHVIRVGQHVAELGDHVRQVAHLGAADERRRRRRDCVACTCSCLDGAQDVERALQVHERQVDELGEREQVGLLLCLVEKEPKLLGVRAQLGVEARGGRVSTHVGGESVMKEAHLLRVELADARVQVVGGPLVHGAQEVFADDEQLFGVLKEREVVALLDEEAAQRTRERRHRLAHVGHELGLELDEAADETRALLVQLVSMRLLVSRATSGGQRVLVCLVFAAAAAVRVLFFDDRWLRDAPMVRRDGLVAGVALG